MIEYDINLDNFKTVIDKAPTNSGVYGFKDDAGLFLYIGQSINLRRRLKEHSCVSVPWLIQGFTRNKTLTLIIAQYERHELDEIEQKLIEKYEPRFNKEWNDSYYDPSRMTSVTITLPVYQLNKVQDMRYKEDLSLDEAFTRPLELVLG